MVHLKSGQLNMICASLGVVLIHARAYSAASKARWKGLLELLRMDILIVLIDLQSLEHLNSEFNKYLSDKYITKFVLE